MNGTEFESDAYTVIFLYLIINVQTHNSSFQTPCGCSRGHCLLIINIISKTYKSTLK